MGKNAIQPHLDRMALKQNMDEARSLEQFRRWQVIYIRLTQPGLAVATVADLCGVQYKTVTQWTWMYNKEGPDKYCLAGRGGRRKGLMDLDEEHRLLEELTEKATKGQLVTAHAVRKKTERMLGRPISKDYAYDLLHRHQWRKVQPRPHHPKRDEERQRDFKKTSRICWLPPETT